MGANLIGSGATFRVWAPRALEVYIGGHLNRWTQQEASKLVGDSRGYWAGFIPNVHNEDPYNFFVVGEGSQGYKRDPYARVAPDPFLFEIKGGGRKRKTRCSAYGDLRGFTKGQKGRDMLPFSSVG